MNELIEYAGCDGFASMYHWEWTSDGPGLAFIWFSNVHKAYDYSAISNQVVGKIN